MKVKYDIHTCHEYHQDNWHNKRRLYCKTSILLLFHIINTPRYATVKKGINGSVTEFFHFLNTIPIRETNPVRKNAVTTISNIQIPPKYIPIRLIIQLSPYPIVSFEYLLISQKTIPINTPPTISPPPCLLKNKLSKTINRLMITNSIVEIFLVRKSLILHKSRNSNTIKSPTLHTFYILLFHKLPTKLLHKRFV